MPPSTRQPAAWLASLLKSTKRAFPRQVEMSELESEAHLEAWTEIARHVGRERFETAIKRCISELTWFPKREEIEARIPTLDRLEGRASDDCKDCDGTGWTRVYAGMSIGWSANAYGEGKRKRSEVTAKQPAVVRCHCWRKVAC